MGTETTVLPNDVIRTLDRTQRSEWLKTGDLPKSDPVANGDPASSAAESEAQGKQPSGESKQAPVETGEPRESKQVQPATERVSPAEKRIKQLLGKVKDANSTVERLTAELALERERSKQAQGKTVDVPAETKAPDEAKASNDAVLRARPKSSDKNADGTDKYADYDAWIEDLTAWTEEKVQAAVESRFEAEHKARETTRKEADKAAQDLKVAEANKAISEAWKARCDLAREKYEDFDAVALDEKLPIPTGSVTDAFVLDSEVGTDILYYLGSNPDELERITKLNPLAQARELFKIEQTFSAAAKADAKEAAKADAKEPDDESAVVDPSLSPTSKTPIPAKPLPPPMREVGGRGTPPGDPVASAVNNKDFKAYRQAQNAAEIQRKKSGLRG